DFSTQEEMPEAEKGDLILKNLFDESSIRFVSYRAGQRYVQYLTELPVLRHAGIDILEQDTFMITGGVGGNGLEIAHALSKRSRCHSSLVSGRARPGKSGGNRVPNHDCSADEAILPRLRQLEAIGCKLSYYQVDISDREALEDVTADIASRYGNIKGVIHCA